LDLLKQDLLSALRGFRRTPAFFATAVLILGVGIGMSVAMFTVFRAVLIRQLPVRDQDRIAVMWTYREPGVEYAPGTKYLGAVRRTSRTMRDVAGVAHWPAEGSPWLDGDRPITMNRSLVTGNFFDVLGVKPVLGRLLHSSDDDAGAFKLDGSNSKNVLVLSYATWQNKFGGDPGVVGHRLIEPFSRSEFTIVGVAPPGLSYPAGVEYWGPIWGGWSGGVSTIAVARLAPGATVAAARQEYFALANRISPELHFNGVDAKSFTDTVLGDITPVLMVLTSAVALLLLIVCINVGNLLLLRASARTREISVRRALGAGYGDIVRQLVVESLALAVAGGALGFGLSVALLRVLVRFAPSQVPRLDDMRVTGAPVWVAVLVTTVAVLVFGVVPALFGARVNLESPLRADSRSGTESRHRRLVRQVLVVSQVALATVMLGSAGLLARSLARLEQQDLGYSRDHLSILSFTFNARKYDTDAKIYAWGDRLLTELHAAPGITAATPILIPPLLGTNVWQWKFDKEGQSETEAATNPTVPVEMAGTDFFRVFAIPVVHGRVFSETERDDAPLVAIVSESVARRFWPGEDPIGKRIRIPPPATGIPGTSDWRTVIGLVPDNHLRALRSTAPAVYLPWHQGSWQGFFAIRSTIDLGGLVSAIRRDARAIDPQADLVKARTMDELLARPLAQPRLSAMLMSGFGFVALLLAALGLFGVMSSIVSEQTRELGIRMALGAMPSDVRRAVLGRAFTVTIVGTIAGLIGAIAVSRLFVSLLFEVSPVDPLSLSAACGLLIGVALAAAYLPARRATQIDPVDALRAD
jgi:putative ABC transport system permease protein